MPYITSSTSAFNLPDTCVKPIWVYAESTSVCDNNFLIKASYTLFYKAVANFPYAKVKVYDSVAKDYVSLLWFFDSLAKDRVSLTWFFDSLAKDRVSLSWVFDSVDVVTATVANHYSIINK
jgi:hypothetical protein